MIRRSILLAMLLGALRAVGTLDAQSAPGVALVARSGGQIVPQTEAARPIESRVTLDARGASLDDVLREIARQSGAALVYSDAVVPAELRVTVRVSNVEVETALREALRGTALRARRATSGELVIERSSGDVRIERRARVDGSITGRVVDAKTGEGVEGVNVAIETLARSVTTGPSGGFLMGRVPVGSHEVSARRIGYVRVVVRVEVADGQAAEIRIEMAPSAGRLDDVVVTGSIVETERKAVPTAMTVVTADEIRRHNVQRVDELFRTSVPGAFSWDQGTQGYTNSITVRGTNTLTVGQSFIKTYVDGVEVSNNLFSIVDVNSIDRVEIIRGPQASTIYGSDASGGVMQIFTKKGDFGRRRPVVDASAALTGVESRHASGRTLEQTYAGSVSGGSQDFSYNLGGSYRRTGDWAPEYELSNPSFFAGARLDQSPFSIDLLARYTQQAFDEASHPELAYIPRFAGPLYRGHQLTNQTYGITVAFAPSARWQHRLTAGFDRVTQEVVNTRARPTDGLYTMTDNSNERSSVALNSSLRFGLGTAASGTLTAGVERFVFHSVGVTTSGARTNNGTIALGPNQLFNVFRAVGDNNGFFAQGQLGLWDAVYVTAGVRAEASSGFGRDYGTAVSPRVGLSLVRPLGIITVKVRGAYGEALKTPTFGVNVDRPGLRANPDLAPEEQLGREVGLDLEFGAWGALSATYYDQTAIALIDLVLIDATTTPPTFQLQNAGRVKNRGWELESRVSAGRVSLQGQFSVTNSTVLALHPLYTGLLRVGDRLLAIPKYSGGGTLTMDVTRRTAIDASVTHLGEWKNTDMIAFFGTIFGGQPSRGSQREYWIDYPSVTKVGVGVRHQLSPSVSAFLRAENVGNNEEYELTNFNLLTGRRITLGARFTR